MRNLFQDIRYGLRTLKRNPGFTATAILTLALGIGANSAIFSVVNTVLLNPLAYKDPNQLVAVWERNTAAGKEQDSVAPLNYQDWIKQATAFKELAAFRYGGFTLTGRDYPEQVGTLYVSANMFRTLGIEPMLGRTFTDEEVQRGERVVVLGHKFWQSRLGGDRALIGQPLILNGNSVTVIGVMPPVFAFPDGQPSIETYSPLVFGQGDLQGRRSHSLTVIGRLQAGATIESAAANLGTVARSIAAQDQTSNPEVKLVSAHEQLVSQVRPGLLVLLGTVGFVLLIACANVANLILVRSSSRRREMAVRASLGAGRWRVVRQLITESLLISFAGGIVGTLMAWWTLRLFVGFSPADLPRMDQVAVDSQVLLFTAAMTLITGLVFGLVPALQISRDRLGETIKENALNVSGSIRHNLGRSVLVVAEVALSLILIAGAGLMIRTILNLQNLDHGFNPNNVLTMQIFLANSRYPIDNSQFRPLPPGSTAPPLSKPSAFFAELLNRIRSLPGVESAGAVTALPLNYVAIDFDMPVVIEGKPRPRPGEEPQADFRVASTGYLQTMGIRLLQGRDFTEFDDQAGTPVMLINDVMASRLFPGEDPLGKRVVLYSRPREIVGVTAAVRDDGFRQEPRPEMSVPYKQMQFGGMTLVVRSTVDPTSLAKSIRNEVRSMDPDQPVYRDRTMQEFLGESVAQPRFTTLLLGAFAVLAMVLALIGIYGVMSYSVAQRTHEIGLRMALGASRRDVLQMVVSQGAFLAITGITIGLAGVAGMTRMMSSLLFRVNVLDPVTLIAGSVLLALATLAATYIPARRATHVDPMIALRHE